MATRPIFVVAGRRRLVAQPDGLTLGFALHLVIFSYNYFFSAAALCGRPS